MNRLNVNARFVATVPLAAAFWVVLGCEMTERKFVSGANIAGAPAALPEAGVDPAPEVESLPLCPTGSACKDTGCRDDRQCPEPTHCDPDMQRCIGCLSNADCSNESSLCRTSDGVCVECLTNSECANDFGASRCGADGKCTPCSNDDDCSLLGNGLNTCLLLTGGNNRCVECINNEHCPNGEVCRTDNGGAAYECVECSSDADCTDPAASRCEANQCVACQADADCDGIGGTSGAPGGMALSVCDAGACVECTGSRFDACANGQNVCDSSTRRCTTFPVDSAGRCDTCVSDAHCALDGTSFCARQVFAGTDLGYACVPASTGDAPGTCVLTPFSGARTITTIDGRTANACLLRATTCQGVADFRLRECNDASDCGVSTISEDGVCATPFEAAGPSLCSIPCVLNSDCFNPVPGSCLGGFCQLANDE